MRSLPTSFAQNGATCDYDVHGIVGVRVCAEREEDLAVVERLLGRLRAPLSREPDILIRYQRELPAGSLKTAERNRSVFDDDRIFLLTGGKKVLIPFDRIGSKLEILCETGARSVPFLTEIIQLTAMAQGFVPVHAAAFQHAGSAVVVTGWTKGGKTETLLAFADHESDYIGDEWVLLGADGRSTFGLPAPVVVWSWQACQMPRLAARVGRTRRALWKVVGTLERVQQWARAGSVRRILPLLQRNLLRYEIRPEEMLASAPLRGRFDLLLFAMAHDGRGVEVRPADALDIAARMSASVQREFAPLMESYFAFQFAFPERRNPLLDTLAERHSRMLRQALQGKEAWTVLHPYPVDLRQLFRALAPIVGRTSTIPATRMDTARTPRDTETAQTARGADR